MDQKGKFEWCVCVIAEEGLTRVQIGQGPDFSEFKFEKERLTGCNWSKERFKYTEIKRLL